MLIPLRSFLCGHAFNPLRLPAPLPDYDLAKTLLPKGRLFGFETKAEARAEDSFRTKSLMKREGDFTELGDWLGEATARKQLPLSPSSSFYFRECRRRLLGAVHQHFHARDFPDSKIRAFHIIHPKWFVPEGCLKDFPAAQVKRNFTSYLERSGVTKADGLLFAGLHGSFDGTGYQLHYHGIVAGEKLAALRGMRGKFGFESSKKIYRPIQFKALYDPPRQISYCLQSWWPYKPEPPQPFIHGARQRLPPEAHAEFLLWMAHQNLLDLVVMSGMRIGKNGLESTHRTTK